MTSYRLHGVRVAAPFALARDGDDGPADVALELLPPFSAPPGPPVGELLSSFVLDGKAVYQAAADGGRVVLRVHGLCDFEIDGHMDRAWCRPVPGADLGAVALVARGAFLALWLGLQGHCTLHGSAIEIDGTAVVFVGGSGMGKSTLAGWACARGARFICDDLLRVDGGVPPRWVGRSPELRLRRGALEIVEGREERWQVLRTADDRFAAVPPVAGADSGPIAAVVIPRPDREISSVSVTRLESIEAVLVLSRFPRLEGWLARGPIEAQFHGVSRLADSVAVYVVDVPWGPPFAPESMDQLLELVSGSARVAPDAT